MRLLTLVGAPGIGKTRLALAAAEALRPAFLENVYFADLSTVRDPSLVLPSIAHALGVRYVGAPQRRLEDSLRRVLRDRDVLLLVDNFEQLLPAVATVGELLAACPRLKILVTSRAPLRIAAEQQMIIGPLAVPRLSPLPPLDALERVPAVELFRLRAQAVNPDWELTRANAADVAELCTRLDGLPLAIELAASWMSVLSVRAMLPELEHTLDLLVGGGADRPERHQTLRGAIAWSYDLLRPDQQRGFRGLAVFAGGWTLEACAALWRDGDGSPVDALKNLAALVDRQLVFRREAPDGTVRFGLLDTIRAFAWEQLTASGEGKDARRRHAEFFVELSERAEQGFNGPAQALWLDRLEEDRDNLDAVLDWCTLDGGPEAVELGLHLGAALWFFWDVRGHIREGRAPLKELIQLPSAMTHTVHRARALQSAGWLAYLQGDAADACRLTEESLTLCRELGDQLGVARSLSIMGTALALHTDAQEHTTQILDEALRHGRALEDTWSVGFSLFSLGLLSIRQGRLEDAQSYTEQCLEVSRDAGNTWGVACALYQLGCVAIARGDRTRAMEVQQESLRLHHGLSNLRVLALNLEFLASAASNWGAEVRVRLFGAVEALLDTTSYSLPATVVSAHERAVTAARVALDELTFKQAWGAGRAMPVEGVVALALRADCKPTQLPTLSARELELVALVAEGLADRQIALRLGISPRTVDSHLRRIFKAVGVSSRTALALWAVRSSVAS